MSFRIVSLVSLSLALVACGDDDSSGNDAATSSDATSVFETSGNDVTSGSDGEVSTTPCDPIANSGCPTGQMCTFVGNDTAPSCVTAGVVELEQPCSSEAACKKGVCLNLNDTRSLCYAVCEANVDCDGGTCLQLSNASFDICKIEGIYENCDLLAQDCEQGNKACYAVASEPEPICRVAGTAAIGQPCESAIACAKGGACVDEVCRELCDRAADPVDCPTGYRCNEFFQSAGYCEPE